MIKGSDIIHAHDVYHWYFPFRFLFPTKKSFITFHGYESYPIKKRAIIVRKIAEKLSNGNIIVGDFIKKWYGTKPDYVVYGGVNIPDKVKEPRDNLSAIFIGRLDDQTGISDYAAAVDIIRQKFPKFKFRIYGDGKFSNKLKGYSPKGFVKDADRFIPEYNFAFVSRYLTILEALANKRPVFALYDNPVKEDYLKMSSFSRLIVIENSAEKLAGKVTFYLNNQKSKDKLTKEGFDSIKNQTWDNLVDIYLKLWEK